MTSEDIIRMAEECGIPEFENNESQADNILRFAALVAAAERERAIVIAKNMKEELEAKFEQTYMEGVIAGAAAEREACAKVCDEIATEDGWEGSYAYRCVEAIRARGQE